MNKIVEDFKKLSKNDQARLIQCILCENRNCDCTEKDEDERGFCMKSTVKTTTDGNNYLHEIYGELK